MLRSLNAWTVDPQSDFGPMFDQLAKVGFEAIELNLDAVGHSAHSLTYDTTPSELKSIAGKAKAAGLAVTSISTSLYRSCLGSRSADDRREALRVLRRQMELAAAFGAGAILVVPGGSPTGSLAVNREESIRLLGEVEPELARAELVAGLENVWNGFFTSPIDMTSIIDELASPWIQAYFDVGNVLAFSNPEDWIEILGSRIARIHVKDFKRQNGINRGGAFVDLRRGDADWPAVARELRKAGYDGPLTAEVFRADDSVSFEDYYREIAEDLKAIINLGEEK